MTRSTLAAALAITALGCAKQPSWEAPPPNDAIANEAARSADACGELALRVRCEGPAAQLDELGALCGFRERQPRTTRNMKGGAAVRVGPHDGHAALVLYVFAADDAPEAARYAAYVDREGGASVTQWRDMEPIDDGALRTRRAAGHECGNALEGCGQLRWKETRLELQWRTFNPC